MNERFSGTHMRMNSNERSMWSVCANKRKAKEDCK